MVFVPPPSQIPSQLSGSAKRKHQLSSLLADAHDNRAELEERIAQARQNRKHGSNKYGQSSSSPSLIPFVEAGGRGRLRAGGRAPLVGNTADETTLGGAGRGGAGNSLRFLKPKRNPLFPFCDRVPGQTPF